MQLEIMFSTVNILLNFLLLKIVSSQDHSRNFAKYRRNEELLNGPPDPINPLQLKEENLQLIAPPDLQKLNDENVQLISPELQEIKTKYFSLNGPGAGEQQVLEAKYDSLNPDDDNQQEFKNKYASINGPSDGDAQEHKTKYGKSAKLTPHKVHYVQEKTGLQWPMGVVPYYIDKEIYDPTTTKRIVKAMSVVESSSCVIFKEVDKKPKGSFTHDAWLHITNPRQERECVHETETSFDDGTVVILGFDCLHPDEILHSMLHAIGFNDEISHPHRDQYVRVQWENIQPKYRPLFRIQFEDAPYKLVEYDPMSIMHFHDRAFSANGAPTIAPLVSGLQIGGSSSLSQLDIMKLKLAFGHECNKRKIGDLLDTCKKALSSKSNHKELADMTEEGPAVDDGDNHEEQQLNEADDPEAGQNVNEEDNPEDGQNFNEEDKQEDGQNLKFWLEKVIRKHSGDDERLPNKWKTSFGRRK